MIRSERRILTTHAGALPRAAELREMIFARAEGKPYDRKALSARLKSEVAEVVHRQVACGVDSVNDGEVGKTNFTNYVRERLAGFEMRDYRRESIPRRSTSRPGTRRTFPQYFSGGKGSLTGASQRRQLAVCVAPLKYVGRAALEEDLQNFKGGLTDVRAVEAFLPANTPGTIEHWLRNEHYRRGGLRRGDCRGDARGVTRRSSPRAFSCRSTIPTCPDGWQNVPGHERARLPQVRDLAGPTRSTTRCAASPARKVRLQSAGELPWPAPQRHPTRGISTALRRLDLLEHPPLVLVQGWSQSIE